MCNFTHCTLEAAIAGPMVNHALLLHAGWQDPERGDVARRPRRGPGRSGETPAKFIHRSREYRWWLNERGGRSAGSGVGACHRALKVPRDDVARTMLLEALTNFKATPLASFPHEVLDLISRSREQADGLSDRILASDSLSDPSIDEEIRAVCDTPGAPAAADAPAERHGRSWERGLIRATSLAALSQVEAGDLWDQNH
jgi:hypothetical protein